MSKKSRKLWIWKPFERGTGRLIDWECGDRDRATLDRLLARLKRWGVRLFCTDEYAPYDAALPAGRHYIGKDQTQRSESNNARQRHWFARFRRRTCVVSRSVEMVDATMALFAHYHCNAGSSGWRYSGEALFRYVPRPNQPSVWALTWAVDRRSS